MRLQFYGLILERFSCQRNCFFVSPLSVWWCYDVMPSASTPRLSPHPKWDKVTFLERDSWSTWRKQNNIIKSCHLVILLSSSFFFLDCDFISGDSWTTRISHDFPEWDRLSRARGTLTHFPDWVLIYIKKKKKIKVTYIRLKLPRQAEQGTASQSLLDHFRDILSLSLVPYVIVIPSPLKKLQALRILGLTRLERYYWGAVLLLMLKSPSIKVGWFKVEER